MLLQLTACVTGAGAGVDSAWEQEKLEATLREMLDAKRAARREAAVPAVQCSHCWAVFLRQTNLLLFSVLFRTSQIQQPHTCLPAHRGVWLL